MVRSGRSILKKGVCCDVPQWASIVALHDATDSMCVVECYGVIETFVRKIILSKEIGSAG